MKLILMSMSLYSLINAIAHHVTKFGKAESNVNLS